MILCSLCGAARAERVQAGVAARSRLARALGMRRLPPEVVSAAEEAMRMPHRHEAVAVAVAVGIPAAVGAGRASGEGGRGRPGVPHPDEEVQEGVAVGKERAGEMGVVVLGVAQRKGRAAGVASSRCLRSAIEVAEAGA